MATQLGIFNDALRLLGERSLAAVTEQTEPARVLLSLNDQVLTYCLEQGPWRFAETEARLLPVSGVPAAYGLEYVFEKPVDFVRLTAVGCDEALDSPVGKLYDSGPYFYSDTDEIYIRYISRDATLGADLALWPETFSLFVAYYAAVRAAPRISPDRIPGLTVGDTQAQGDGVGGGYLQDGMEKALEAALQYNQVNGPQQFLPESHIPTQLSVMNNVMNLLGGRTLTKVTDATEAARVLLALWDSSLRYCLEQGHWKFALREVRLEPSTLEVPIEGHRFAFQRPCDLVRISEVSSDERFHSPIFDISERADFWYTDLERIFIRYVSMAGEYGRCLSRWPESFEFFFTLYLATRAAPRLAPASKDILISSGGNMGLEQAKRNALSKDAVAGPTQFLPQGNWSSSRFGGRFRRGRNSRSSLYGS